MYQIDFQHPVRVWFVGIGGISMSGLAMILAREGFAVGGSDKVESAISRELEASGIRVAIGQRRENITDEIDLAVFSAAIHPDNPEYEAVLEKGIPFLTRAELLGQLMKNYRLPAAVSGTHGKTTTTSILSEILLAVDADPTLSIGGILPSIGGNVRIGGGKYFVAEACEYTDSFLQLFPKVGIILNIEEDHLDYFKDLHHIRKSFRRFAELIPADGVLVINAEIRDLPEITGGLACKVVTFSGTDPRKAAAGSRKPGAEKKAQPADYYPSGITYDEWGHPSFELHGPAEYGAPVRIRLRIPGTHNVGNAIAAIAAAEWMGISREDCARGAAGFTGTERRFQYIGEKNGFTIIDDYAHHPTEIMATLRAAGACPHRRIVCVFQPHTYTRTKALLKEFAQALTLADVVVLAKIYPARETDTLGVSSETLRQEILRLGHECLCFPDFSEIEKYLLANCRKGDLVITMGAGNVDEVGKNILS
ncbi:MAG: UDP-N-acetylmuramate--L-alanine ligase [Eubacteriales bacterium]|nr:UDP-N-acetylmuramate--L-alanine ligase [Eubacteriales bacterium]